MEGKVSSVENNGTSLISYLFYYTRWFCHQYSCFKILDILIDKKSNRRKPVIQRDSHRLREFRLLTLILPRVTIALLLDIISVPSSCSMHVPSVPGIWDCAYLTYMFYHTCFDCHV